MDFLVTGATGFIGQKIVSQLLARGDGVNYLARKRSPHIDQRAAFHRWNGQSLPPLDSVPRLDAIIHLLGEPIAQRWTPEVKQRIRQSRIQSTRQLVAGIAKLRHKPKVLISASAVGYYGDRGNEVLSESSMPGQGFLPEVCLNWEYEAAHARELGLRVALIRIATVLGREGGALPKMLTPFRWGIGGRFGSGKQWMSWIHVDDLIRLFLFAADTEVSGALNGAAPNPVTNAEFTRVLARAVHRPALFPIPRFALKTVLGEMSDFLFDSLRVVPEATQKAGFTFEHPDLAQSLQELVAKDPARKQGPKE
jgi:uncharacterized protein (TIGR01777 family)